MSDAGFNFLSEGKDTRQDGTRYGKLLFFRELETLEFVYVTVVEVRIATEWFEVAISRLKKIIGSLGTEEDAKVGRTFQSDYKSNMDVLEEAIEFADLMASYDSSE